MKRTIREAKRLIKLFSERKISLQWKMMLYLISLILSGLGVAVILLIAIGGLGGTEEKITTRTLPPALWARRNLTWETWR